MANIGRRPKLTPNLTKQIADAIRRGAFLKTAAGAAGIDESTFHRWRRRGRKGERPYCQFCQQIEAAAARARSDAETRAYRDKPEFWLTHGPAKKDWHPYRAGELELSGRVQTQPMGVAPCPAPIEHLAQAYNILQELGVFPRTEAEGQKLLEAAGMTLDVPSVAVESRPIGQPAQPTERRPASLRRAKKAMKAAEREAETRVAHRNMGNGRC